MLHISDFSKSYGDFKVLSIPDLTLGPGIYWIKGENGAGKTSLLKSIAGISPFEGEISCDNVNLRRHPVQYRMLVNYSEAEPLYPGFLTANDLIRFMATAKKTPDKQLKEITAAFGVDIFLHHPSATYSSGMLKKVSLAAAFLGNPAVVILDEPFITIDGKTREALHLAITKLLGNVTFIVSSHQPLGEFNLSVSGIYSIHNKTLVTN